MNKFNSLGINISKYQYGTRNNGIQLQYSGPQYYQIIEKMKRENPKTFPRAIEPMPKKSFQEQSENYKRKQKEARWDRANQDLKSLLKGFNNTFGFAASGVSLIGGGGWALTRLLNGNRASTLGRTLAPLVLPSNTADTAGDIIDFVNNPSWSGAAEIGVGIGLGKWKDFGSKARQISELGSQTLNIYNATR